MRKYFRPKKITAKYAIICLFLLALATGAAIAGFEMQKGAFYALAAALVFFSVQIFTVYILSTYEYGLDGGILYVYRVTGKRKICIFDLDLTYAEALLSYKDSKLYVKEKGKPKRRFYCLSGLSKRKSSALFYNTDMRLVLYFAPDEMFFEAVKSYIR